MILKNAWGLVYLTYGFKLNTINILKRFKLIKSLFLIRDVLTLLFLFSSRLLVTTFNEGLLILFNLLNPLFSSINARS